MTLLVLDPKQHGGELFDPYHRVKVANEVNAAILQSQGFDQGKKIASWHTFKVFSRC